MKTLFKTTRFVGLFPKDPKRRKKIYTFSSFVLLSILFWLIIKLSQDNEARINVKVNIFNVPAELIIQDISHETLEVELQTVGARMLYINLSSQTRVMDIDFEEFSRTERNETPYYYITERQLVPKLPAFYHTESEIVSIRPDTLLLEVRELDKKKVPVAFRGSLDFLIRYRKYGDIALKPDSVYISGPKNLLETIDTLYTKESDLANLDKPVDREVEIINPFPEEHVTLFENHVKLHVDVRQFTESKAEVEMHVSCPEEYKEEIDKIRLFPSKATIFYLVALEDYGKISEDMFSLKVECPFEKENTYRLNVIIESKPPNVEILRVDPPRAEYILLR